MLCPSCSEVMEPTNASGTPTHTCLYCNGVWISRQSLDELLTREGKRGSFPASFCDSYASTVQKRCPTCTDTSLHVISAGAIEIDVCVSCDGIFLDEGEIRTLLPQNHSPEKNAVLGLILNIVLGGPVR